MFLVKISEGIFVNTSCIGKIEFRVDFVTLDDGSQTRKSATTIYDATGVNVLCRLETSVNFRPESYEQFIFQRDNFVHEEVIRAIRRGVDARSYAEKLEADSSL